MNPTRTSPGRRAERRDDADDREPAYPGPTTPTIGGAAMALSDELGGLEDWAERYEFLIELGRRAPDLPDGLRTKANRVRGCLGAVYLAARVRPGTRDVVEFLADSDGELVRGLLALLQSLLSGRHATDILAYDLPGFLDRVGLETNLTTSRRNGLAEVVKRLRGFAAAAISGGLGATDPEPGAGSEEGGPSTVALGPC